MENTDKFITLENLKDALEVVKTYIDSKVTSVGGYSVTVTDNDDGTQSINITDNSSQE